MILLFGFAPAFGLPDPSPFVMKTEVQLKMAGLAYRRVLDGRPNAPKGKLPYIDDDGVVVADSVFIRDHLERKYRVDLDSGLNTDQRSIAWAAERMIEDNLFFFLVYARWQMEENFLRGPATFFNHLPQPTQNQARETQRKAVLSYLHGQGTGRHSPEEVGELARRSYAALSRILGDKPYLIGNMPCATDASMVGHLANAATGHFDSPVRDAVLSFPNLTDYRDRLMTQYFPELNPI